jgi:hypothetical protein
MLCFMTQKGNGDVLPPCPSNQVKAAEEQAVVRKAVNSVPEVR